jgi:hypothetical protein
VAQAPGSTVARRARSGRSAAFSSEGSAHPGDAARVGDEAAVELAPVFAAPGALGRVERRCVPEHEQGLRRLELELAERDP